MRLGLCAVILAAAAAPFGVSCRAPEALPPSPAGGAESRSNVLRTDYVGSEACAGCHAGIFRSWRASPMHRMTRDLQRSQTSAPFDGASLRLGEDRASLELLQGQRFLRLSQGPNESLYRVTKVIGGRYREDFVGELVSAASPLGAAQGPERVMPLSFLRFDGTLRYKGYSVMVPERPRLAVGLVWQQSCILCHNTAPQLVGLLDELYGPGAPSYQGSVSNELPPERALRYVIDDAAGLRAALGQELLTLGASGPLPEQPRAALGAAIASTKQLFGEHGLVELGVGCESCHGGSRAHAEAPERAKPSYGVRSELMHVETPQGEPLSRAQEMNHGCAKCHTVLFSQYPYTWEGGQRRRSPGGSTTNSGEARDFLLGGCATAMTCSACHDPHGQDASSHLQELMTPRGNRVCTGCHERLAEPGQLKAHAHHSPTGAGGACLNCHMPKKNMGLAYDFTAYHRIGSPTDTARVQGDRPLECALCHADRSVEQIVATMEKWWNKSYDRRALSRLYGADLAQSAVRLTLIGGKPHEKALAADVAARQKLPGTLDATAALLGSEYPLVRYFARSSLERRLGLAAPLDMSLPAAELVQAGRAWLTEATSPAPGDGAPPP